MSKLADPYLNSSLAQARQVVYPTSAGIASIPFHQVPFCLIPTTALSWALGRAITVNF